MAICGEEASRLSLYDASLSEWAPVEATRAAVLPMEVVPMSVPAETDAAAQEQSMPLDGPAKSRA